MNVRRSHRALSWLILLVLLAASTGRAEDAAFLRVRHDRPGGAIAGERVTLSVEVLIATWLSQAATITVPEIPGLVIFKVSSFGINGTERIGALTYTTQAHEFAVFARRSGRYEIPPFRVRFAMAGPQVGTSIPMDLETVPIELVAEMPPGAEGLEGLIAAPALSVTETWDPDPEPAEEMSVGGAISRSVTYRAEGVMGMAFPPTLFESVDGLSAYPQPPELDDRTDRGEFQGSRVDSVTYVFERPGTFVLPGLEIPWWDLDAGRLRTVELASRMVVVVGGEVAAALSTRPPRRWWMWLAPILLIVGAFVLKPLRRRVGGVIAAMRLRREERAAFQAVIKACRPGDAEAAYRNLRRWIRIVVPDGALSDSASEYGDPDFLREMRDLERHALTTRDGWRGDRLAGQLPHWRKFLKIRPSRVVDEALPPLNP